MKKASFLIISVGLLWIIWIIPLVGQQRSDPIRLLFLTHAAGYRHEVLPQAAKIVGEEGVKYGIETTATEDVSWLSADKLKDFDAVLFYTSGELPLDSPQKADFLEFVKKGGGFSGVHSATDTFYEWEEFGKLIGGYFDGHPWHTSVSVEVLDRNHPATRHLEKSFRITDEIYQFRAFDSSGSKILLALDKDSVNMEAEGVRGVNGFFPLSWTRNYGSGKVFYTALGHRQDVWEDPRFQKHLFAGILWTVRD